jgi:hypothetical protein
VITLKLTLPYKGELAVTTVLRKEASGCSDELVKSVLACPFASVKGVASGSVPPT